jgi:dipeptidase
MHVLCCCPAPPAGVFNISNCLSIRTVFDRCSQGLQAYAQQKGLWDGQSEFDFAAAFSDGGAPPLGELTAGREANGHRCAQRMSQLFAVCWR